MGGLVSGVWDWVNDPFGNQAPKDAIEAQKQYTNEANDALGLAYNDQKAMLQPYGDAGLRGLAGMEDADFKRDFTAADFQKDPGYDFRMSEGLKAIERSAAARGGLNSGATMKALTKYNQDFASNEYNNAYNRFNADRDRRFGRLSSLAGIGQNATGQLVAARGAYGTGLSNNLTGLGNAIAGANLAKGQSNQALTSDLIGFAGKKWGK